jgi:integral membrane protein (TIGR01906 family)
MQNSPYTETSLASRLLRITLRFFLALAVPLLLGLGSARLVMTPLYLNLEYNRAGFPPDFYGFSTEDRLDYAPYALDYLLNGEGIHYLGDLTFDDGSPLFNEQELEHMVDVKVVTQAAFGVGVGVLLLALVAGYILWRIRATRKDLWKGLMSGSLITLGLIAAIVLLSVVSWDVFFTGFHQMFFAQGTWQFLYSDTLIRMFPEQFWFDAALVIGTLTSLGAIVILILSLRAGKSRPSAAVKTSGHDV